MGNNTLKTIDHALDLLFNYAEIRVTDSAKVNQEAYQNAVEQENIQYRAEIKELV